MQFLFGGQSLQNKRRSNMDSMLLKQRTLNGQVTLLAVVCDGVGSLVDSAIASAMATQQLNEWFSHAESTERIGLRMRDVAWEINRAVLAKARQDGLRMATTLSALLLTENNYYITHIGDCRVYECDGRSLSVLTHDDVSESGKLTACIGISETPLLQYYEGPAAGKTFLVCSDGLYKGMDAQLLLQSIPFKNQRALTDTANKLIQSSIDRGSQDNISLALIKAEM